MLNACPSGLSVATGISNVATLSTFAGLFLNIPLDAASLAGARVSGVATVLTRKYKKKKERKLMKVTKLVDIVTSALETSVSKALNNGEIDEQEFQVMQDLHLM